MRKKYRSHLGVLLDILKVINEDPEPTISRIILLANIPYNRLKGYLDKLEEKGYIKRIKVGGKVYVQMTEKGLEFYLSLQKLSKMITGLGFPL